MVGKNVGKYRILDKIGRGGMGTVYKAVDEMLHREVAIKVLNAELNDPEIARRFRSEAITVARLSHPGIATIYELFEHEGEWLMVMEFVRGETLENMVARMGPLSAQRAAEFCMQALAALAHAHSMGVVHRDLKPANLMVTENGSVKVMDFGIARVAGGEHLTNAGFMMGTPAYMAPEQVRGGEIDARADLYSMGVVFYRLATAKLPFKGDTAFAIVQSQVNDPPTPVATARPDLPSWVDEVINKSLAKAPDQRFQSAAEFHEAFARCLAGLTLSSMYAGGTGEIMLTPPRPMPSGAFLRPAPMPTPTATPIATPMFQMTGSHQTMLAPGTNPGGIAAPTDPTVLTPAAGSFATPAASATQAPVGAPTVPLPALPARRKSSAALLAVAGVVLVGLGVGAWFMFRGNTATQTETLPLPEPTTVVAQPAEPTPAASTAPQTPPPGTALVPSPTVPPAAGAATPATATSARGTSTTTPGVPGAGVAGPVSGSPNAARGTAPAPTGTPVATPEATPSAPVDTALATFTNVRIYTVNDKRTLDREVSISFVGGQVQIVPKSGGAAVASVPYKRILRATYSRGRDPKWDASLPGPPEGLDVGTFMRQTRHWLVVQGAENFAVLRLEDNNFRQILETFEQRTGIKVDRRAQ